MLVLPIRSSKTSLLREILKHHCTQAHTSPMLPFESANTNVFTVEKNGVGAKKNGNKVEEGYVEVTPKNAGYDTTEKLNVTVKDIWGYTKKADINVTVKPNSAN